MKLLLILVALTVGDAPCLHAQTLGTRVTLLNNLRIGAQGDSDYTLTGISSLAVLSNGSIVVVDVGGRGTVRMYDRSGRFVRYIARTGQGPNEFSGWQGLGLGTIGDRIWIADRQRHRVMILDTLGGLRGARSSNGSDSMATPSVLLSDGTGLIEPVTRCEGVADWSATRVPITRVDSIGAQINVLPELRRPPCGERVATGSNGWTLEKLSSQFTDEPLWGWQPGGSTITLVDRDAVAGDTAPSFRVRRLNADGSIVFDRSYPYTPIPLTAAAMDSAESASLGAAFTGAARAAALSIDWHFPAHMPTVSRLMVANDGSAWLQREAQDGSRRTVWTIIGPDGERTGEATIPAAVTPLAADVSAIWGVERDADGMPAIVRFRLIYVTRAETVPGAMGRF